jgi:putative addiction module component
MHANAMATKDELLDGVLKLPREQRAEVAHELLRSLDEDAGDDPAEVEASWEKELCRRADEILSGTAQTTDAFEAIRRVREDLHRRRISGGGR